MSIKAIKGYSRIWVPTGPCENCESESRSNVSFKAESEPYQIRKSKGTRVFTQGGTRVLKIWIPSSSIVKLFKAVLVNVA